MTYCPLCGTPAAPPILAYSADLTPAVAQALHTAHPGWRSEQGVCPACAQQAAGEVAAARSQTPLPPCGDPAAAFPYYHSAEETLHPQGARLPCYHTFDGHGVTIAFLDSGFFPHPDLLAPPAPHTAEPDWAALEPADLCAALSAHPSRLTGYVDLTNRQESSGLDLASLWDAQIDSWHGQMTTCIAAGSGRLSGARWRSFAPGASVFAIKIGRGGGRIPEEDILAGFQWLLRDDNWQRLGVRVLNVSVGGDYPMRWEDNPVCLAAEELSRRGVLVTAAAGNSGRRSLLAPAQAPSVLTVGGVDDHNLPWDPLNAHGLNRLTLYHHNYDTVLGPDGPQRKPELLALARYLPSPLLLPHPATREARLVAHLRAALAGPDTAAAAPLVEQWIPLLPDSARAAAEQILRDLHAGRMPDGSLRRLLCLRAAAHKAIDAAYQHVDGTSVAVAQVSAVAAQMFQANPALTAAQAKALLIATALEMPHWPVEERGAGLLQPAAAVAAALRVAGGPLEEHSHSPVQLDAARLRKWVIQGKLSRMAAAAADKAGQAHPVYFGLYAPGARAVSVIGSFNQWMPSLAPLERTASGWWRGVVLLPSGRHPYRFWVEDRSRPTGEWQPDPENLLHFAGGYRSQHSVAIVD